MNFAKIKLVKIIIFPLLIFFCFNILAVNITEARTTLWNEQVGRDEIGQAYGESRNKPADVRDMVVQIIRIFLSFLALIFVILIVWGGYKWMTSLGNVDKVSEAKGQIKTAIYGLVIILLAFAITEFIFYLIHRKFFFEWY